MDDGVEHLIHVARETALDVAGRQRQAPGATARRRFFDELGLATLVGPVLERGGAPIFETAVQQLTEKDWSAKCLEEK